VCGALCVALDEDNSENSSRSIATSKNYPLTSVMYQRFDLYAQQIFHKGILNHNKQPPGAKN
jgi:hypothetical protein